MEPLHTQSLPEQFGITHLATDTQEQVLNQFTPLLLQSVMTRALSVLSEDQLDTMATLGEDVTALLVFLDREVPDFMQIWQEEIRHIRDDIAMIHGTTNSGN